MTKSFLLRGAAFFFAAVSPVFVCAQFQQPTDEELKMTADPKAPGADAVYLDIEEIANDPMHYKRTYVRAKVLAEKGKELATVELPYLRGTYKITDIKGRTIHPDGTVISLTVKPEDLMVTKIGETQFGKKVFTLASVEVGSILEYSYEMRYDDDEFSSPQWEIQRRYFVHKAHYQFTPFKQFMPNGTPGAGTSLSLIDGRGRGINSLVWWYRLPPGITVQTSVDGSYSVNVTDVPAMPHEDWMPPMQSLLEKVGFYYSTARNPGAFWPDEVKLWSKDVDKFAEPSKTIRDAVSGLIAPADSDLDKAKKLYDAVQALDNTDYSRKKGESELKELKIKEARNAGDIWTQKSGSSEDIAKLYLAMLRAAGLTAYATRVVDRNRGIFDPSYMSMGQLDTTVVILSAGGKQIVLDPGEKMCPFQTVNWRHSGAAGIGQSAQGLSFAVTPMQEYKGNTTTRTGLLTLDVHGGITGTIRIVMTGQTALRWRQAALRMDDTELKMEYDRELERIVPEGVEAHVKDFLSMDDPYSNLMAVVDVKGSLGTATSKRLLLPAFFFETRRVEPFVNEEKRLAPVDMQYGDSVSDEITYDLPQGMTVEGAPQDASISWPSHALFIVKTQSNPGQILIADALARAFTLSKPEEYQDLRGFYQKVAAADQGQLVLTVAPPTAAGKGN